MPRRKQIAVRTAKVVYTAMLTGHQEDVSPNGPFNVTKLVVTVYEDRAKAEFTGTRDRWRGYPPNTRYNLFGYRQYPDLPEWAESLVKQAGYLGRINRGAGPQ